MRRMQKKLWATLTITMIVLSLIWISRNNSIHVVSTSKHLDKQTGQVTYNIDVKNPTNVNATAILALVTGDTPNRSGIPIGSRTQKITASVPANSTVTVQKTFQKLESRFTGHKHSAYVVDIVE